MGRLVDRVVRRAGLANLRTRLVQGSHPDVDVDALLKGDLLAVGAVADAARRARHGRGTRFGRERVGGAEVVVRAGESAAPAIAALRSRVGSAANGVVIRPDPVAAPTGEEVLRAAAVARIALDVPHVAVSWEAVGIELAQVALSFGVDELLGPVAGASALQVLGAPARGIPRAELEDLLRKADWEPVAVFATEAA